MRRRPRLCEAMEADTQGAACAEVLGVAMPLLDGAQLGAQDRLLGLGLGLGLRLGWGWGKG